MLLGQESSLFGHSEGDFGTIHLINSLLKNLCPESH